MLHVSVSGKMKKKQRRAKKNNFEDVCFFAIYKNIVLELLLILEKIWFFFLSIATDTVILIFHLNINYSAMFDLFGSYDKNVLIQQHPKP